MTTTAPTTITPEKPAPVPCNRAEYVGEVTIPDGTQLSAGASFTKVWRLRNAGSCTWTPGYVLLFDHGDSLSASSGNTWSAGTVPPGAVVDVSVPLIAPSQPGTYQAFFRLRSPDNIVFGIGSSGQGAFWVKIVVPPPIVSSLTLASTVPSLTPTVTDTQLPPLPDFDQVIGFGLGGGDTPCLDYDGRPLPSLEGSTVFDDYYFPRTAILCIWGVPFGTPLSISLTSPRGQLTLPATIEISSSSNEVSWLDHASSHHGSAAAMVGDVSAIFLNIWWPTGLESGEWQASVHWDGGEANGTFQANTRSLPEIALVDPRFDKEILPGDSHCHFILSGENRTVEAESFPPNTLVYVLVFKSAGSSADANFLFGKVAKTNQEGFLTTSFGQSLGSGKYYVLGVSDPQADLTADNGNLNFAAIGSAVDCFNVP